MMESSATTTLNPAVTTMRRLAVRTASSALDRMHHRHQNFAEYPYQEQMHTTQENFMGIFPMLKRIVYYLFVGAFLLATSMATYGIFYLMAMPAHAATEKLHFDYSCKNLASPSGEAPVCVGEAASSGQCQYSCSPSATVDIFATHTPWEALHPDVIPDAKSKTRILRPRKHYFLEVVLQLPESITNQQIGMFAVEVELQTKNNIPLARSKRSARLPHESGWIGVIRKSICLVPLLVGALTESRSAIIPSFRHFVESSKHPLQHVIVKLISQGPSWQGSSNIPIEVIAGELRIGKELNQFQTVLKEWFWTSFMFGTTIILLFQCLFYLVASFLWESQSETVQHDNVDLGETPYFFDATPPQSTTAQQQQQQHGVDNDDNPFSDEEGDDQWEAMSPIVDDVEEDVVAPATTVVEGTPPDLNQEQQENNETRRYAQPAVVEQ